MHHEIGNGHFTACEMIQTWIIIGCVVVLTFFMGVAAVGVSFFSSNDRTIHKIAQIWGKTILLISRIRVTVIGMSNIDQRKSYIYMSNHQSNFDIPVLLAYLDVQFRWLAKAELFKIPIFGPAMRRAGYISIDRSNRKSSFLSLKKAADTIRNGASVMIFPEGTRSRDGNIRPFKKGGFILAVDSGAPVVPVILHGTWSIMPRNGLMIRPGTVTLEIMKPIETDGFSRKTKDDLLEKVNRVIHDRFEKGKRGEMLCSN
ncbi:MAG: lysophospholipid acyltransferase family protein [Thermodesulfobacteriota bacterium]